MRELQKRARQWVIKVFGAPFLNKRERALRVLEEAIELAQAYGITREEALAVHTLVFSRPVGDTRPEIGDLVYVLAILAEEENLCLTEEAWATHYKNDDSGRIARIRAKCRVAEKVRGTPELAQLCREF